MLTMGERPLSPQAYGSQHNSSPQKPDMETSPRRRACLLRICPFSAAPVCSPHLTGPQAQPWTAWGSPAGPWGALSQPGSPATTGPSRSSVSKPRELEMQVTVLGELQQQTGSEVACSEGWARHPLGFKRTASVTRTLAALEPSGLKHWVCLRVKILTKQSLYKRGVICLFTMRLQRSRECEVVAKLKRLHGSPFPVCFSLRKDLKS